ncbi:uncharacterized protein LOC108680466 isoform X1 [Hyalella azteca]|uniref:Uncharacterized protein LOC108680466 isoform X1 n=1 Tax=Hyalella azteca TaxID=294128 RepID=A0A979FWY3_HYAAZ|nr:uncharacterized protein LOC108680466 isoform X1 [Hyalella azteca]
MTASSKNAGTKKFQSKKPLSKQILKPPLSVQWPPVTKENAELIKLELSNVAQGLRETKRLRPPWKLLRKIPKAERAEEIQKFRDSHLAGLSSNDREAFIRDEKSKKEKLTHLVMGYNEIMRHLNQGSLGALLVNKNATPELLPKSFLPGCYCRCIPVVAIENLHEFLGKCIAVGFRKSVAEKSSPFHNLYSLLEKFCTAASTTANPASRAVPSHSTPAVERCKAKSAPPVVDVSRFHLIRGSVEQANFLAKLSSGEWSADFLSLSSANIPDKDACSLSFEFRKKVGSKEPSSKPGYSVKKQQREPVIAVDLTNEASDALFELDLGADEGSASSTSHEMSMQGDDGIESVTSVVGSDGGSATPHSERAHLDEGKTGDKLTKTIEKPSKRKARDIEERLTGAAAYVPAAVVRVVGNSKRKKLE